MRTATAPCWRKTKKQRVDEKVSKLLSSYNDVGPKTTMALTEHKKRSQLTAKYFPGKDIPLTAKENHDVLNAI